MVDVSLARKKKLDQPDQFLTFSNKALIFLEKYKFQVTGAIAALFVIAVSITMAFNYFQKRNIEAFEEFSKVIIEYNQALKEDDLLTDKEKIGKKFENFINSFSGTKAANLARVNYANFSYKNRNYDKAINLYKEALEGFDDNASIKNLILSNLGFSYEEKKDFKIAIHYFEQIAALDSGFKRDEALFHMGMLYSKLGNKDRSKEAYNKIITDHKDSMYYKLVKEKTME